MNRRHALVAGGVCAGAFTLLALIVIVLPATVDPLDVTWNDAITRIRSDVAVQAARALNVVGGGWVATWVGPVLLTVVALIVRGWRTAIVVPVMLVASTACVQLAKYLVGRERPEHMLVTSDVGSFPSGHTANAATIAVVLCLVMPRVIGVVVGVVWVSVMALSRTVLSVHWFTDTIGGALIGVAVGLLVIGAFGSWAHPRRGARGVINGEPASWTDGRPHTAPGTAQGR